MPWFLKAQNSYPSDKSWPGCRMHSEGCKAYLFSFFSPYLWLRSDFKPIRTKIPITKRVQTVKRGENIQYNNARVPGVRLFLVLLRVSLCYKEAFGACLRMNGLGLWVPVCVFVGAKSSAVFLLGASPTPDSFTSPISPASPPWQPASSCEYLCALVHFLKARSAARARLFPPFHRLRRKTLYPKRFFFHKHSQVSNRQVRQAAPRSYLVCAGKSQIT